MLISHKMHVHACILMHARTYTHTRSHVATGICSLIHFPASLHHHLEEKKEKRHRLVSWGGPVGTGKIPILTAVRTPTSNLKK